MDKNDVQAFLKKHRLCPICEAKKLLSGVRLNNVPGQPLENGAAPTPPMGWASWNP